MFLMKKLFLLFIFNNSKIFSKDKETPLLEENIKDNKINNNSYESNNMTNIKLNDYDPYELFMMAIDEIRNEVNNNIKIPNKNILNMLEILKKKIKIIKIELNKMEVIFKDKKNPLIINLLTEIDKNTLITAFSYVKIPMLIKSNFEVYRLFALKILGGIFGIFLIKFMVDKYLEDDQPKKLKKNTSLKKSQEKNNYEDEEDIEISDELNQDQKKEDFQLSNNFINLMANVYNDSKEVSLLYKYILSNLLVKDNKEINKKINELFHNFEKNQYINKNKNFKNLSEIEQANFFLDRLEEIANSKSQGKESKEKIRVDNFLNRKSNEVLSAIPKEILKKILVEINNKNLQIDNYVQNLPKTDIEKFEIIKNNICSGDPAKRREFYIFNGDGGSGKTKAATSIAFYSFFAEIYNNFINGNNKDFKDSILMYYTGSDFGVEKYVGTGNAAFEIFVNKLLNHFKQGKKVYVVIDEADLLLADRNTEHGRYKDSESQNRFLEFLDKINDGIYSKYKDQFKLFMTTNFIEGHMDKASVRRGTCISFIPLATEENLFVLIQNILDENANNPANTEEETIIYNMLKKYFEKNKLKFQKLLKNLSFEHKKMFLKAKLHIKELPNDATINEEIKKIDFNNDEVQRFMSKEAVDCGAIRVAKIINALYSFITYNIINSILYKNNQIIEKKPKKNITIEDLKELYKPKEKQNHLIIINNDTIYEWIEKFFEDEKNIEKLEKSILEEIYK